VICLLDPLTLFFPSSSSFFSPSQWQISIFFVSFLSLRPVLARLAWCCGWSCGLPHADAAAGRSSAAGGVHGCAAGEGRQGRARQCGREGVRRRCTRGAHEGGQDRAVRPCASPEPALGADRTWRGMASGGKKRNCVTVRMYKSNIFVNTFLGRSGLLIRVFFLLSVWIQWL
jgi:hypothetical protein